MANKNDVLPYKDDNDAIDFNRLGDRLSHSHRHIGKKMDKAIMPWGQVVAKQ